MLTNIKFSDLPQVTPCPPYRVNVPWRDLEHYMDSGPSKLNLEPDYQRGHVWTEDQSRRYVEWVLSGGMSGRDIFCNHPGWMRNWKGLYEVVDGKQRITAALNFKNNKLTVFGGRLLSDFEGSIPWDVSFNWHVNNFKDRRDILKWYIEMNEGLTAHTQDELDRVRRILQSTPPL